MQTKNFIENSFCLFKLLPLILTISCTSGDPATSNRIESEISEILNASKNAGHEEKVQLLEIAIAASVENHLKHLELESRHELLRLNYTSGNIEYILEKSETILRLARKLNDHEKEAAVLRYLGHANQNLGLEQLAFQSMKKALTAASKINYADMQAYLSGLIHISLSSMVAEEERNTHLNTGIDKLLSLSDTFPGRKTSISTALQTKGMMFMDSKDYDSAEYYFKKNLTFLQGTEATDLNRYPNELLGILNISKQKYEDAIYWFKEALTVSQKLRNAESISHLNLRLYDAYDKLGQQDSSQKYLVTYTIINDSLTKSKKTSIDRRFGAHQKNSDKEPIFTELLLALGSISIITSILWFAIKKENKKRYIDHQEPINSIESSPNKEDGNKTIASQEDPDYSVRKNDLWPLEELIKMGETSSPAFLDAFQKNFPDFETTLSQIAYPNKIVATEYLVCAYMKLNFSTKEIAQYSNSTVRSIEGKKYRIRKKLNIKSDEDLNIWMSKI
ncbi:hypothetical protein [Algoriphagus sp. NG3]|uniref:helix-turn-helix transcriptional regulator n=1 Tax=Algoriphagus sp. NG3 TaxID=3097546 RepID=UPI002A80536F|nr:hypothetical protein [Algoriphagus sp. NG3]WPR77750.1 hypothetical protein SLW71_10380 [Algoriphagus sp. NG3]